MEEQAHPLMETSRDAEPWSWTGSRGPLMFGVGLCVVFLVEARTIVEASLHFLSVFPMNSRLCFSSLGLDQPAHHQTEEEGKGASKVPPWKQQSAK